MVVLNTLYPWIKVLHLVAVISWMAGLLYLPRLYVYHVETKSIHLNAEETIIKWEYLLLKRIMNPAMVATWIFGIMLALTPNIIDWSEIWIWVKLISVILMSGFHGFLIKQHKLLERGIFQYSGKQYRFLNEIPTALMIIIIIMVIVRPF